jgi:mannose-6-phosphate isomerase
MKLYPLKFHPILKERLWGGTKLKDLLGKPIESEITGESWELSAVDGDVSVVENGSLAGKSLQELIDSFEDRLLGEEVFARFGHNFPILIKFIDARLDLSIQLHPNDELARKRHNSFGKTEMWYIMDAEKDGRLIVGFNRDVSKKQYENSLAAGSLPELLHYETVREGDTFFINTGKIHAIGAGVLLAEIQQTSDITYRVFDFNRRDKEGKLRELHTELALDAIDYKFRNDFRVSYPRELNVSNPMVYSPYFKTNYLELDRDLERTATDRASFTIFMCVSGSGKLYNEAGSTDIRRGETVLMPASSETLGIKTKKAKFLEVTL